MKLRLNTVNDDIVKPEASEKEMCKAYWLKQIGSRSEENSIFEWDKLKTEKVKKVYERLE